MVPIGSDVPGPAVAQVNTSLSSVRLAIYKIECQIINQESGVSLIGG